jgi:hypothetical protein
MAKNYYLRIEMSTDHWSDNLSLSYMQLSYFEAIQALQEDHVLLIGRCAFSSEEELR